jgi:hypothetical protein
MVPLLANRLFSDSLLGAYFYHLKPILLKWLNHRSHRKSYNWAGFKALLADFGLAKPRICHDF